MELPAQKQEEKGNEVSMEQEQRGIKVKLLVTRRELELLVMELKKGEKGIEDILVEMGEEREKSEKAKPKLQIGWKPKLGKDRGKP
jgi:hypothetical protein